MEICSPDASECVARHADTRKPGPRRSPATCGRATVRPTPARGTDVSIRGQVLNLLLDIQQARGIAYVMITHDISIARAFADRVAVMLRGEIVESGPVGDVLVDPRHEYTRRLLAAVPELDRPVP